MTSGRPQRWTRHTLVTVGLTAVLTVGALGACTITTGTGTGTQNNPTTSQLRTDSQTGTTPTPAPDPTAAALATAKRLTAMYDYDGATAALAGITGAQADAARTDIAADRAKAVVWPDNSTISHIFYHSLIVDPARAFDKDAKQTGYNQYMVTMHEFKSQMEQIYQRGFVLVLPQRIAAKDANGVMAFRPILLPPGKTPLVLSQDDLSYYEYMAGDGFADRLIVDGSGKVTNVYTDASGNTLTGSYDLVPLIDDFVEQHPDFSYRGDKGVLALTGYNGVLGYRTSIRKYGDNPQTLQAIKDATVVADAMKKEGWEFASHSWGHLSMTKESVGSIRADAGRWDAEVRPILGDTPLFIYPFGADIAKVEKYTLANPKYAFLHGQEKFDYFFPIDASTTHWMQLSAGSLRQARINIDGISMQHALNGTSTTLNTFFDVRSTIDPQRPLPVPLG